MAMQRRFPVGHADVFPAGAFLKGGVEPVGDFNADKRPDGSRPQQLDKDSGLPMWQVTVLDADEEAGKKGTALSVKIAAKVQPVPPENTTPFPWTPVEFVGLTALAYVDDNGNRPRLAWSFRAESLKAPVKAPAGAGTSAEKVA
ncbi:plasmid replication, integration and excision activator [Janibacter sp. GS2]|uniref:plasmid replication, integration and excision activator n=1 Tax=Janibacter sp. GS2 TaxID=3442646 RepID=UPI003EB9B65A